MYKYLPDDIDIKSLVVLSFDIGVDVHAQHFSYYTYMPSKLEISFYLDYVFVCAAVLLAYFQDFYLKFELLIKLRADFEYLQRVMPVIFMI